MFLRGGKQLEGPMGVSNDEYLHDKHDDKVEIVEKEVSVHSTDLHKDDVVKGANVVPTDSKETSRKPYTPPLPFPQRNYILISPLLMPCLKCPLMQSF